MESKITLNRGDDGWYKATFSGPIAESIIRQFGTDTLPTPYSNRYLASFVLDRVRSKNPDCEVVMGFDGALSYKCAPII